jgi:hypothetical protein
MTTRDEEARAIEFLPRILGEWVTGRWPTAPQAREVLRLALRHYPVSSAILRWRALSLPPRVRETIRDRLRAGEPVASVADDYGLSVDEVRTVSEAG